jgi:anti-sigma B factor antagonist
MVGTSDQRGLSLSLSTAGHNDDIHVIRVDGIVDTATSPELDSVIGSLVGQSRYRIIIDLGGTEYISSAGWGIFISRLREIREGGGDLKLARMTTDVREVFDLLEFEGILPRFDRLEAAQSAFNGGNGGNGGTAPAAPPRPRVEPPLRSTAPPVVKPVPKQPEGNSALETAILGLIAEDPFYRLGEIKERLGELGHRGVNRWTIWQCLRRHKLLTKRRRFRHFRRYGMGSPSTL